MHIKIEEKKSSAYHSFETSNSDIKVWNYKHGPSWGHIENSQPEKNIKMKL